MKVVSGRKTPAKARSTTGRRSAISCAALLLSLLLTPPPPATAAGSRGGYNPPPATGSHYVIPNAPEGGDGSREHPFRDLQTALCLLRPGDKLVMRAGRYRPVAVAGNCVNGNADKYITVIADKDAVLKTENKGKDPLLTIERAFWRFEQMEIPPDRWGAPAVRIQGKGAHHIEINKFHIHRGWGNGIIIVNGAHDIRIHNTHMHHLGDPRGNKPRFHAAAILMTKDVRGVTLRGSRVHHIRGLHPFQVEAEEGETIQAPGKEQLEIIDSTIPTGLEPW